MAWGLFPLVFAAAGLNLAQIGALAAVYPAVWGVAQIFTGALSDRVGRKWLIASGMWVQAAGIAVTAVAADAVGFGFGAVLRALARRWSIPPRWRRSATSRIHRGGHPPWACIACGATSGMPWAPSAGSTPTCSGSQPLSG